MAPILSEYRPTMDICLQPPETTALERTTLRLQANYDAIHSYRHIVCIYILLIYFIILIYFKILIIYIHICVCIYIYI